MPLSQVAQVEFRCQPAKILRRDGHDTVTVKAGASNESTPIAISNANVEWLDHSQVGDWPVGYKYELSGEIENAIKANESIADKMPIGLYIIIMLLVVQFNSVRRIAIIPLELIGVATGLLVVDSYFGFMTSLGIISLASMVINNAIVLLDRIRIEIDEDGLDPAHARIDSAQLRLGPILLTTPTTNGGLFPLWLSGGPMWEPHGGTYGHLDNTRLGGGFHSNTWDRSGI